MSFESIPDICEFSTFCGPNADPGAPFDTFIELPHGATELRHLAILKAKIPEYPGDYYDDFFMANTDQGSPEYAHSMAEMLTSPGGLENWHQDWSESFLSKAKSVVATHKVLVMRSLVPRTILDVNRTWEDSEDERKAANLTAGVGPFVKSEDSVKLLRQIFEQYSDMARSGYEKVCGSGGFAFNLHTYAPITVSPVEGECIVKTLHRAYTPEHVGSYPRRPVIELITATPDGEMLANPELSACILDSFRSKGFEPHQNDPFNLHPSTMAFVHADRHRQRVVTMEVSRELLATRFNPFTIMRISRKQAQRVGGALATAYLNFLIG